MWAGLGYYRRARYLLEGAQYVMEHHGGAFPRTSKELQKIPGPFTCPFECLCSCTVWTVFDVQRADWTDYPAKNVPMPLW